MSRSKHIARAMLLMAGVMLYLFALAYLYSRPEVRVLVYRIAPVPALTGTEEAGCKQNQTKITEETVRRQLDKNQQRMRLGGKQ